MEIHNLKGIDFDTLFAAFEMAFSDYDIHFEKEEVRSMLQRRGFDPLLSFAAFDQGSIVAFTFNGIGNFNGALTAYDTGTGTVKEYRGQGIAGEIFTYSIPFLKDAGVNRYLLEVLHNNQKAISVYRRMNFDRTRQLDCFRQSIKFINNPVDTDIVSNYQIIPVDIDFIIQSQCNCDCTPSWQNSIDSIVRGKSNLKCLGAFLGRQPVGHCVFDPGTGDLTQIAVTADSRRKGIASALLSQAVAQMKTDFVKVLNIDADDQLIHSFLKSKNIPLASTQYEMMLQL